MPFRPRPEDKQDKQRYKHEDYSIAIIKNNFKEYIDDYKYNYLKITTDEVCELLKEGLSSSQQLFWRNLISSQYLKAKGSKDLMVDIRLSLYKRDFSF